MKGISAVIGVILLLLVTISIVGVSFVFFTGTQESIANTTQGAINTQALQAAVKFQVEAVSKDTVYLRNIGSQPVASSNIAFYVNGALVQATGPASLPPGQSGAYVLDAAQLSDGPANVRVAGGAWESDLDAVLDVPEPYAIRLQGVDKNNVTVSNLGTQALTTFSFTVNGVAVNHAGPSSIASGASDWFALNDSVLALQPDPTTLAVTSNNGVGDQITADFYGAYTAAYWKFDEGAGNITADSSGNGNTAVFKGTGGVTCPVALGGTCPEWDVGIYGSGIKFNSSKSHYLTLKDSVSLNITDNITIQAWTYQPTVHANSYQQSQLGCGWVVQRRIGVAPFSNYELFTVCRNNSIGPHHEPYIQLGLAPNGPTISTLSGILLNDTTGKWTHWTGVYSGSQNIRAFYVNGSSKAFKSTTGGQGILLNSTNINIGFSFNGTIDEIRILRVVRSMNLSVSK